MELEYLINKDHLKIAKYDQFIIIANKLEHALWKGPQGQMFPVDLQGLGNTGRELDQIPWLITLANTRTSYIFLKRERVAPSYIAERLHMYERQGKLQETLSTGVQKILEEL